MAAGSDVRDILEVAGSGEKEFMTKDALMYSDKKVWYINPVALRKIKIVCNVGLSECNMVNNVLYSLERHIVQLETLGYGAEGCELELPFGQPAAGKLSLSTHQ